MVHVFENLKFVILKNHDDSTEEKISSLLKSNGCSNLQLTYPDTFKLQLYSTSKRPTVHFVVTNSIPSNDIALSCFKLSIPVVNIDWVLECIKREKIVPIEPFQYFSNILKNHRFYISRYSFNEQEYKFLRNLILLLGGDVTRILSKQTVTHLVLKNNNTMENDPLKQLLPILNRHPYNEIEEEIHIVDEVWLFDKYFNSEYGNTIIKSVNSNEESKDYNPIFHKSMFDGYEFLMDLQMEMPLINHLSTMIKSFGGAILLYEDTEAEKIPMANRSKKKLIYLGEFYGNPLFNSIHTHHDILKVNLNWIFQCILQQGMDIFIDKDGHSKMIYRIPNQTQKKLCSGMRISYTQFFGLQRFEIIDKIEMLGGVVMPNLDLTTDLLIVGISRGPKYRFGIKNNIHMVTPSWLDVTFESYSRQPFDQYIPSCEDDENLSLNVDENVNEDVVITSSPSMIIEEPEVKGHATTARIQDQEERATFDTTKFNTESAKIHDSKSSNRLARKEDEEEEEKAARKYIVKRTNKRQKIEDKARDTLFRDGMKEIGPLYNIHCVTTQCLDGLTNLDKEILKLIGIEIFDKIDDSNIKLLNGVIAPRRLRTFKFLLSLSFEPLEYALIPEFITDILAIVKNGQDLSEKSLRLDLKTYCIPEMDTDILQRTKLPNKVFSRGNIINVNMSSNMQGGTETLTTILKSHGIKNINVLKKKFSISDIVKNENHLADNKTDGGNNETTNEIPQYILITDQQSQVKQFKKILLKNDKDTKGIFIVEWNWCVQCIFGLDVSYSKGL
ncbi:hypothetical protein RI543_004515 [Arxiozyma heterogenica]|uniref:BRCT domain-containing protein n=1 Tax=Arxiozyma heterogenica TaxID=278026 RepID=A0AAN7ZX30_9SACH|nr:hypothetical protein RI543_004515 [Kazachstania heterogenica]